MLQCLLLYGKIMLIRMLIEMLNEVLIMKFIEPKNVKMSKVEWSLPQKTIRLVEHYANYTGYSVEEVVSKYLDNLLFDEKFKEHIKKKRNNKRILLSLFD